MLVLPQQKKWNNNSNKAWTSTQAINFYMWGPELLSLKTALVILRYIQIWETLGWIGKNLHFMNILFEHYILYLEREAVKEFWIENDKTCLSRYLVAE